MTNPTHESSRELQYDSVAKRKTPDENVEQLLTMCTTFFLDVIPPSSPEPFDIKWNKPVTDNIKSHIQILQPKKKQDQPEPINCKDYRRLKYFYIYVRARRVLVRGQTDVLDQKVQSHNQTAYDLVLELDQIFHLFEENEKENLKENLEKIQSIVNDGNQHTNFVALRQYIDDLAQRFFQYECEGSHDSDQSVLGYTDNPLDRRTSSNLSDTMTELHHGISFIDRLHQKRGSTKGPSKDLVAPQDCMDIVAAHVLLLLCSGSLVMIQPFVVNALDSIMHLCSITITPSPFLSILLNYGFIALVPIVLCSFYHKQVQIRRIHESYQSSTFAEDHAPVQYKQACTLRNDVHQSHTIALVCTQALALSLAFSPFFYPTLSTVIVFDHNIFIYLLSVVTICALSQCLTEHPDSLQLPEKMRPPTPELSSNMSPSVPANTTPTSDQILILPSSIVSSP